MSAVSGFFQGKWERISHAAWKLGFPQRTLKHVMFDWKCKWSTCRVLAKAIELRRITKITVCLDHQRDLLGDLSQRMHLRSFPRHKKQMMVCSSSRQSCLILQFPSLHPSPSITSSVGSTSKASPEFVYFASTLRFLSSKPPSIFLLNVHNNSLPLYHSPFSTQRPE